MTKSKIIYIAGLGHSGSTVLDMSLGCHSQVVGLGEVADILRRKDKNHHLKSVCSCGKKGYDCDFWGNASKLFTNVNNLTDEYLTLADYFFEKYGNDKILVDSSKNSYSFLKILNKKYDLKVIFLTRDFRSWAFSRFLSNKKPIPYYILRWWAENKKLEARLKKMNLNYLQVGYEEFSLYPEIILRKICNFAGIDFDENMLTPSKTHSHIIAGNIARIDNEKRKNIVYDARWMTSAKIMFWAGLSFFLNSFNKKRVYSNVLDKSLDPKKFKIFEIQRRKDLDEKYN